jgi:hypothetical protein
MRNQYGLENNQQSGYSMSFTENTGQQRLIQAGQEATEEYFENSSGTQSNKKIFSASMKSRNSKSTVETTDDTTSDPKQNMQKQLKLHLDSLKSELTQNFTNTLREFKNEGKMNTSKELQEIKKQITSHRQKFEEIQSNIQGLSRKFSEINTNCVKELEIIKQSMGLNADQSMSMSIMTVENDSKRLDQQVNNIKDSLVDEINNTLQRRGLPVGGAVGGVGGKGKSVDSAYNELKDMKQQFENDLKNNFDSFNNRVKKVEDNVGDIWKKKASYMENVKNDISNNLANQEKNIGKEIADLKQVAQNKPDENTVRQIVISETKKGGPEVESAQKTILANQDEIQKSNKALTTRLDKLDQETRGQLQDLKVQAQFRGGSSIPQDQYLEQTLSKLNQDSEHYKRMLAQLQGQIEEIKRVSQQIQMDIATNYKNGANPYEGLLRNLEGKVGSLENDIKNLNKSQSLTVSSSIPAAVMQQQSPLIGTPTMSSPITYTSYQPHQQQPQIIRETVKSSMPPPSYEYHPVHQTYTTTAPMTTSTSIIQQNPTTSYIDASRLATIPEISYTMEGGKLIKLDDMSKISYGTSSQLTNNNMSTTFSHPQFTQIADFNSQYFADPKVKNIIEEFNMNKRNQQQQPQTYMSGSYNSQISPYEPQQITSPSIYSTTQYNPNPYAYQPQESHSQPQQMYVTPDVISNLPVTTSQAMPYQTTSTLASRHMGMDNLLSQMTVSSVPTPQQQQQLNANQIQKTPGVKEPPQFRDFESYKGESPAFTDAADDEFLYHNKPGNNNNNVFSVPNQQQITNPFGAIGGGSGAMGNNNNTNNRPRSANNNNRVNTNTSHHESEQFVDCNDNISGFDPQERDSSKYESFLGGRAFDQFRKSANEQPHQSSVRPDGRGGSHRPSYMDSGVKPGPKALKHQKILAQIDYFINGTLSSLISENEDEEIFCNLDDDGYIFDEDGDYVLDVTGNKIKLSPDQIEKFKNNNMIE